MPKYEKYQLQWMIDHGYSLQDLMNELTQLQHSDPNMAAMPVTKLFEEWMMDSGFGSEIWACEDEWSENEGWELMNQTM